MVAVQNGKPEPKNKLVLEYIIHSSPALLFEFITSPSGLSEWFADNVRISPEKVFTFEWDNGSHKAMMIDHRINHFTIFEFIPETAEDKKDASFFELRLELDELTQTTFLKVTDYSDFEDLAELRDIWSGLVENLKTVIGG